MNVSDDPLQGRPASWTRILALGMAACALGVGCHTAPRPDAVCDGGRGISGRVVLEDTGAPLPSVRVRAEPNGQLTHTDADGCFVLGVLPPGRQYTLYVEPSARGDADGRPATGVLFDSPELPAIEYTGEAVHLGVVSVPRTRILRGQGSGLKEGEPVEDGSIGSGTMPF